MDHSFESVCREYEVDPRSAQGSVCSQFYARGQASLSTREEKGEYNPYLGAPTADEVSALLPGVYYMDPPDGGSVTLLEQLQRMAADAARYRLLRRKVCIVGDAFHIINHAPRYVAPDAAVELDATLDAALDAAMQANGGQDV